MAFLTEPLVRYSGHGRVYKSGRKVRLGDATPDGRLRLDALTRYAQDISNDDTTQAGLEDSAEEPRWIARSTVVDTYVAAQLSEKVQFTTFCSGLGKRWAERRLSIRGSLGARYEVATLWICIDRTSGRPCYLSERFLNLYGPAAVGREVKPRKLNPKPEQVSVSKKKFKWPLRAVDFDIFGHVNNASYWSVVEEALSQAEPESPYRCRIEYGAGIDRRQDVDLTMAQSKKAGHIWWFVDKSVAASALIAALPDSFD